MHATSELAAGSNLRGTWLRMMVLAGLLVGLAGCGQSPEQRIDAARAAMAKNDYGTAVIELKNVLQENPDNPDARQLLAETSFALGDALAAEKELERAYELGVDAAANRVLHYRIQLALGHFEEVSISLEQPGGADGLTPAETAYFEGEARLGLRRVDEAEASFREALVADPAYAPAKVGLAQALLAQNERDQALDVLDEAIEAHPEQATAWLVRGQVNLQAGRLEPARDDLQRAVEAARAAPDRLREYLALAGLAEAQIGLRTLDGAEQSVAAMRKIAGGTPITLKMGARLDYAREQYPEARAKLQQVLKGNSDDAAALFLLGAIYLAEGDLVQAELNLARVVRLAPDNLAARQLLAQAQLQQARPESAVEALAPLLESERPLDAQTSFLASQALLRSGDTADAVKLLERSHADDPANMQTAMSLGAAYLSAGRIDDAIALFESVPETEDYRRELLLAVAYAARNESEQAQVKIDQILAKNPDDAGALLLVGQYYLAAGRVDESRLYLERVLEQDPRNIPARESLARIGFRRGDFAAGKAYLEGVLADDPDNQSALMVLGEIATVEQRLDEAITLLERATEASPRNAMAFLLLARARLAARDQPGAERAAARAGELAPESPLVLLAQGEVSLNAGRYREASAYFAEAVERQPGLAVAWHRLARAQIALEDRAAARASLERALEIDPRLLVATAQLALLDSAEGDTESALAMARQLQKDFPDNPVPDVLEGEIYFQNKDFTAAAAAFERAYDKQPTKEMVIRAHLARVQSGGDRADLLESWLAEHPDDERVRLLLAEHRQQSGDDGSAIAEYERALESSADNVVVLNNLAYLLHEQGDPRAEDFARRAHELRPDLPPIQDTLGWILLGKGKVEEARPLLEAAHAGAPEDGEIAYHYAVALQKSGESSKSTEILRELLAADRPFESRADAERLLAEIGGR